jgi:hypothetical protein
MQPDDVVLEAVPVRRLNVNLDQPHPPVVV